MSAPTLSADEIERYHHEGCLGPFRLCSPEEMAITRREIEEGVLAGGGPTLDPAYSRHQDSPTVYDLCAHPAVVGRLSALLGPDLMLWISAFWITRPGDKPVPWHQDFHYWPMEPPLTLTAWLAITPATEENGCLSLIPGSHLESLPHVPAGDEARFAKEADPEQVDESRARSFPLEPGQFLLFNDRVLHSSAANRTAEPRIGLGMRYTLPFVKLFRDRLPLFPDHRALMVTGEDRFGFNRIGQAPTR